MWSAGGVISMKTVGAGGRQGRKEPGLREQRAPDWCPVDSGAQNTPELPLSCINEAGLVYFQISRPSGHPVQGPPPPQVERKNTAGPPWLLVSGETSLELRSQPALRGAGAGGAPALQRRRRGSEGAAAATGPSQPRTHALLPPPELPRGSHLQVECKTQSR